jgi:hypothetical protein
MTAEFHIQKEWAKLWNRRWLILGVSVATAVVVALYSLFLKDEFYSYSSFIPPNISDSKSIQYGKGRNPAVGAGGDVDIERVLSYLMSDNVTDKIVTKFDLFNHYEITSTDERARGKQLQAMIGKMITFGTVKYTMVQIGVYDFDPKYAADIANEYTAIADSFVEAITKRKETLKALTQRIENTRTERQNLLDSLRYYRSKYNLFHVDDLHDQISGIVASSMRNPTFSDAYDKMIAWETHLQFLSESYSNMIEERSARESHLRSHPSLLDVTNIARPAKLKARPMRGIFVMSAFASAFALMCLVVIIKDRDSDKIVV